MALRFVRILLLVVFHVHRCVFAVRSLEYDEPDVLSQPSGQEPLCDANVVAGGCAILGGETPADLMRVLALHPTQVQEMLDTLLLDEFTCQQLCERAVESIPRVLHAVKPAHGDEMCLSADCGITMDVSPDHLRQISARERQHSRDRSKRKTDPGHRNSSLVHKPTVEQMIRRLLAVLFKVFPAMEVRSDGGTAQSLLEEDSRLNPVFGHRVLEDRKHLYTQYNGMAFSLLAEAIRKLDAGRDFVKVYFSLRDEEVDAQLIEARHHLTLMLDLFTSLFVRKGFLQGDGGECEPALRVMAYVHNVAPCEVDDFVNCGEQEDGRFVMYFCESYWGEGTFDAYRVNIMIHESSHHFGTQDYAYCWDIDCFSLSTYHARNNADTYSELVYSLVNDETLAETGEPELPPCADSKASGFLDESGQVMSCLQMRQSYCAEPPCPDVPWWCTGPMYTNCPVTCHSCPRGRISAPNASGSMPIFGLAQDNTVAVPTIADYALLSGIGHSFARRNSGSNVHTDPLVYQRASSHKEIDFDLESATLEPGSSHKKSDAAEQNIIGSNSSAKESNLTESPYVADSASSPEDTESVESPSSTQPC